MKVINIKLDDIIEDVDQPRKTFVDSSILELAESIKQVGLLNPIKVRVVEGNYKIIFGNRRFKACKEIGLIEIPCIVSDNENEMDIYLEQLTENIQRENFTPVEEALAFQQMLDKQDWRVSKKILSGRLGKSESYISRKIDLLIFGEEIKHLIHNNKEILPNVLSEEQVLKLKKVAVEYRDQLALKVANEQVSVNDVQKIADLFNDVSISSSTKERLVSLKSEDLVTIWYENETDKVRFSDKNIKETHDLIVVNNNDRKIIPNEEKLIEDYIYKISPLQEKVNQLNLKVPSFHPLPSDVSIHIDELQLDARQHLISSISTLIDNLEAHLSEWKHIQALLEKRKNLKTEIRLIK